MALHQPLDVIRGFTLDDLHCVYLGVTLKLMHLWFDSINRQKPYYIGNKVINSCTMYLCECKVHPDIVM